MEIVKISSFCVLLCLWKYNKIQHDDCQLCLQNLSFTCKETVKSFSWLHTRVTDPCDIWFQETYTSYGLCHSFNMMPMRDLLNGTE